MQQPTQGFVPDQRHKPAAEGPVRESKPARILLTGERREKPALRGVEHGDTGALPSIDQIPREYPREGRPRERHTG